MSEVFDRLKQNGQAACVAVRTIPKLLAAGRINQAKRRQLAEAIERNRREIDMIALELSDAESRALDLAGKISGIWATLGEMVADADQDMRRVA